MFGINLVAHSIGHALDLNVERTFSETMMDDDIPLDIDKERPIHDDDLPTLRANMSTYAE